MQLISSEKKKEIKMVKNARSAPKHTTSFHLTHPDKILFPGSGITKLDVANYYDSISKWILPYVTKRPLSLVRCPNNFKECFFQKHLNNTPSENLYSEEDYIYLKNVTGLIELVQLNVLEIHTWGSRLNKIDYPDYLTFDLDPDPTIKWQVLVETALRFKQHLHELNLTSFVKTTGGKGLHIVVPIKPEHDWTSIKNFTHAFVNLMVAHYPDQYVSEMSKAKRRGKIFLDYLRNQRSATAVAPYSTRARKDAPVSTPIAWDEFTNKQEDTFYTLLTLPKRLVALKKDPWQDFFTLKQRLKI